MENKLVLWAGSAQERDSLAQSIKQHLDNAYAIKERELTTTDDGFSFLFDDETHSTIEISFGQHFGELIVTISGCCSWDVVRLYNEILCMLPDWEK